jgi:hypothetical protein
MMIDKDGMTRVNLKWKIEGKAGKVRTGELYELHAMEVMGAEYSIRLAARRGDTVTIERI